jgi:hypothetical protein
MEFDLSLDLRTGWIVGLSATVLFVLLWRVGKRKCHDQLDRIAEFCRKWL